VPKQKQGFWPRLIPYTNGDLHNFTGGDKLIPVLLIVGIAVLAVVAVPVVFVVARVLL
jgi:hypothetical protein